MMHCRTIALFVVALAFGAPLTAHAADKAEPVTDEKTVVPTKAESDTMDALWDDAKEARIAENWELCRAKARAAWALKKHYKLAGLMGFCEVELSDHTNAAEHLAYFIERQQDNDLAELTTLMANKFDIAKKHVSTIVLSTNQGAAILTLNDKPLAAGRHFLAPGRLLFGARMEGFEPTWQTVDAVAGNDYTVNLSLEPVVKGGGDEPPLMLYTGIGVAALGVVGVGIGIGMTVVADGAAAAAASEREGVALPGCTLPIDPNLKDQCSIIAGEISTHNTARTVATTSFVVGGVLVGAGAGMMIYHFVSEGDEDEEQARWLVTPMVGPQTQGLNFQMTW